MKDVFRHWPEFWGRLQRREKVLWLFDYDGTLAPIVNHPGGARTAPAVRKFLQILVRRFPKHVGILSGRPVKQVRQKVGIGGLIYGGTHGFEIEGPGFRWRRAVSSLRLRKLETFAHELRLKLNGVSGLWIEKKGWSFCVHYRQTRPDDRGRVRSSLKEIRALAQERGFKVQEGLKALEIFADNRWDKGRAARWLLKRCGAVKVLYIGDDTTDEAAFRALGRSHATVRVGLKRASKARYYLKNQRDISALLEKVVNG